jgi:hypothetical protein
MEYFDMTAPKKPTKPPVNPGPTDEPGEQPNPDADSFVELTGALGAIFGTAGFNAAAVINAMSAAQTQGGTGFVDRYLSSSFKDTDIGMDEVIRGNLALGFQSQVGKKMVMDHVESIKAMNVGTIDHARNSADQFYGELKKSTSTHAAGLLDAFGLETDNEVLTTVALTKLVQGLANEIAGIKQAIFDAVPKT